MEKIKQLKAIIQPFRLDDVRDALYDIGIQGMNVSEVKGFSRQKGHTELYRDAEYVIDFLPNIQIDIALTDDMLDRAIEASSGFVPVKVAKVKSNFTLFYSENLR